MLGGILIVCVVILLVTAWWYRTDKSSEECQKVPGIPSSNPERGNLDDIQAAGGLPGFLAKMHAEFGPIFSFWFGRQFCVSIGSHQLFREHCRVFDRPALFFANFMPLITRASIQYANGVEGRHRRSVHDAVFSHGHIVHYYEILQNLAYDEVKKLSDIVDCKSPVELSTFLAHFIIKITTQFAFGKRLSSDEAGEVYQRYMKGFDLLQQDLRGTPIQKGVDDVAMKESQEFLFDIIRCTLDDRRKMNIPPDEHLLIDAFLENNFTDDVVLADAMTYFIGSFHTTTFALTWLIYYLCKNPDVEEGVIDEIKTVLPTGEVLPDNKSDLVYLRAVIDETLRCAQVAPYAARVQSEDSTLGGYPIPANTPVVHALGVAMNDKDIFPEPERFDPGRFLNTKLPSFAFEPFGFAGKRRCPAQQFAYVEMMIVTATILPRFRFRLVEEAPVKSMQGIVMRPASDIIVNVEHRK